MLRCRERGGGYRVCKLSSGEVWLPEPGYGVGEGLAVAGGRGGGVRLPYDQRIPGSGI